MRVLVTGGAASGKSGFAERVAASLSERRCYVATMRVGPEAVARIERHRNQRAHLAFDTLECPDTLVGVPATDGVVLVDDLGNLCANALFLPDGTMADEAEVSARILLEFCDLCERAAHVVVVHVEAGCAGRPTDVGTARWLHLTGSVAARLAACFDVVVEVVCGVPCVVKGTLR